MYGNIFNQTFIQQQAQQKNIQQNRNISISAQKLEDFLRSLDKIEPELVQEIDNKFDDIYSKLPLNRFVRKIVIPSKVGDTYKSITILGIGEPKRGEIDPVDLVESYEHDIEYPVGKVPKVVLTNVVPMNILK
jgi:hypothetical protein